jgi:hypothetical protein
MMRSYIIEYILIFYKWIVKMNEFYNNGFLFHEKSSKKIRAKIERM